VFLLATVFYAYRVLEPELVAPPVGG
jgi:hypothetical protein